MIDGRLDTDTESPKRSLSGLAGPSRSKRGTAGISPPEIRAEKKDRTVLTDLMDTPRRSEGVGGPEAEGEEAARAAEEGMADGSCRVDRDWLVVSAEGGWVGLV